MAVAERPNDKDNNQEAAPVMRPVGGNARGRRSPAFTAGKAFLLEPAYNFDVRTQLCKNMKLQRTSHETQKGSDGLHL